jgi:hypothetical protein
VSADTNGGREPFLLYARLRSGHYKSTASTPACQAKYPFTPLQISRPPSAQTEASSEGGPPLINNQLSFIISNTLPLHTSEFDTCPPQADSLFDTCPPFTRRRRVGGFDILFLITSRRHADAPRHCEGAQGHCGNLPFLSFLRTQESTLQHLSAVGGSGRPMTDD